MMNPLVRTLCVVFAIVSTSLSLPQWDMKQYLTMPNESFDSSEHGKQSAEGAKSNNCSCGWTNKARIVGGKETLKNEYPLMVGIMKKGERQIFCGGTLVTARHVITAAHCPHEFPNARLTVALGEHDQSIAVGNSDVQIVEVARSIIHEKYDDEKLLFDIALLFLAEKVEFTNHIGVACMPSGPMGRGLVQQHVKVLGWGRNETGGPASNVLFKANLKIIPVEVCAREYIKPVKLDPPHQICTFRKGQDSCQGDSGGPVLWLDPETNRYILVAVVSHGKRCGKKSPSVNVDVSHFIDWIQKHIHETDSSVATCSKV